MFSATLGQSKCSLVLSGLFRLTPSLSTSGKSLRIEALSLFFLCRIYEYIFDGVYSKDLNFKKVIEENFGHQKLS